MERNEFMEKIIRTIRTAFVMAEEARKVSLYSLSLMRIGLDDEFTRLVQQVGYGMSTKQPDGQNRRLMEAILCIAQGENAAGLLHSIMSQRRCAWRR